MDEERESAGPWPDNVGVTRDRKKMMIHLSVMQAFTDFFSAKYKEISISERDRAIAGGRLSIVVDKRRNLGGFN